MAEEKSETPLAAEEPKSVTTPENPTTKQLNPPTMAMEDLAQNIELNECRTEYLARTKVATEEFVYRTYKLVSLRTYQQRGASNNAGAATSTNMINALIQSNLLTASTATRYLEKSVSKCTLKTSLPEDLFGYINNNLKPLREKLKEGKDAAFLLEILGVYFKALQETQKAHKDELLKDREQCCAGSNDFGQMAKKVKELKAQIITDCALDYSSRQQLDKDVEALTVLYTKDADYAAQKVCSFIFNEIEENAVSEALFTEKWLTPISAEDSSSPKKARPIEEMINSTLEKYVTNLQEDLDPGMVPKALQALVTRFANHYFQKLLERSTAHKSLEASYFKDNAIALEQVKADIDLASEFFQGQARDQHKPLIESEMELLDTIHKVLAIAAGLSEENINDCIMALQARVEKYDTLYYIMGDLYHLVNPADEKKAYEATRAMASSLRSLNRRDEPELVPGLSLRTMLGNHLWQSRGQRTRHGAGVLNNFFGRIGGVLVPTATGAKGGVAAPQEKLTYEELEKELLDTREELEEANDRAQQAEFQVGDLRQLLAKANERAKKAEAKIKEMERSMVDASSNGEVDA